MADERLVALTEDDIAEIEGLAEYRHNEDCWPKPCRCFNFSRAMRQRFEDAARRSTVPE